MAAYKLLPIGIWKMGDVEKICQSGYCSLQGSRCKSLQIKITMVGACWKTTHQLRPVGVTIMVIKDINGLVIFIFPFHTCVCVCVCVCLCVCAFVFGTKTGTKVWQSTFKLWTHFKSRTGPSSSTMCKRFQTSMAFHRKNTFFHKKITCTLPVHG